jgi:hypothetical protein
VYARKTIKNREKQQKMRKYDVESEIFITFACEKIRVRGCQVPHFSLDKL